MRVDASEMPCCYIVDNQYLGIFRPVGDCTVMILWLFGNAVFGEEGSGVDRGRGLLGRGRSARRVL